MVTVKPVRDIHYAYFQINYLDLYSDLPNFVATVANSGDYLQAVYPIAPFQFINQQVDTSFIPDPLGLLPAKGAAGRVAQDLWLEGELLTAFQPERIIGIVPHHWFTYYQLGDSTEGAHFPMVKEVAFVQDDRPLVTAHELGHSYGLCDPIECYLKKDGTFFPGLPASGFWVQRQQAVTNSIDYMGTSAGAVVYPDQAAIRWSTKEHFDDLFRQFRTQPNDPEVLLVTGTISQNGMVVLGPMYRVLNGTVNQPPAGDASVTVLDASGNIVAEVPFIVDFRILTDPPTTIDTAPFAFSVPYPPNAAQVQIARAGQVLARTTATTKLLLDAVESIPDAGFVRNPSELKNALENKIGALEAQLSAGDLSGAHNKLKNDIRKHLMEWLVDNYPTQTLRQYTKTGVLSLVDELLQRIGN